MLSETVLLQYTKMKIVLNMQMNMHIRNGCLRFCSYFLFGLNQNYVMQGYVNQNTVLGVFAVYFENRFRLFGSK